MRPIDRVVLDAIRELVREQRQVPATLVGHIVDLLEDAPRLSPDGATGRVMEYAEGHLMFVFEDMAGPVVPGMRADHSHRGSTRSC